MTKNKKLKNKKRYLGNPFTVAFLPVLAAAGLTLGATGMSLKGAASEESKQHDIVLPQPSPETTKGWKVSAYNNEQLVTKARKGELITFVVQEPTYGNEEGNAPTAVKINNIPYKLFGSDSLKYTDPIEIPFIETMTISLDFTKEPEFNCKVKFLLDPDGTTHYTIQAKLGGYVDKPTDPSFENYKFLGWYKDSGCSVEWDFAHDKITEQNTIIYSKWQKLDPLLPHNVIKETIPSKYDMWALTTPDTATLGQTMDIHVDRVYEPTELVYFPQAITINGRMFALQQDPGLSTRYIPIVPIVCPFMEDMKVAVLFEHILPESHLVTFDSQGGTSVETQLVKTGDLAKEPSEEEKPSKDKYEFKGWYTDRECTGDPFNFSTPINDNITLYAKWEVTKTWEIKYIYDNGTESIETTETVLEGSLPQHAPENPTKKKDGHVYTFQHWIDTNGAIGIQTATQDMTYNAVFKDTPITNRVSFVTNCDILLDPQTIPWGEKAEKPVCTREGYEDVEWYTEPAFTNKWDFDNNVVTKPVILYAKWTPKKYKVTFKWTNYDGTIYIDDTKTFDFDSMPSHEIPEIKEPGYDHVFVNWQNVADKTYGLKKVPANNDTVYEAIYKRIPRGFVVTFNSNGGSEVAPLNVLPGEKATKPENPSKGSFTLEGWYKEESLTNKWDFDIDRVNEDTTLYAKWNETPEKKENLVCGDYDTTNKTCTLTGYKGEGKSVMIPTTYEKDGTDYTINKIGDNVFMSMTNLKEVVLPETVKALGRYCFQDCINLEKINTEHVKSFGYFCFGFTEKITTFTLTEENTDFTSKSGRQFYECKLKSFKIAKTTTSDKTTCFTNDDDPYPYTFRGSTDLEEVWLPRRIKANGMGHRMFENCSKLNIIRFEGTWDEWVQIVGSSKWKENSKITHVWCYNGDLTTEPADKDKHAV